MSARSACTHTQVLHAVPQSPCSGANCRSFAAGHLCRATRAPHVLRSPAQRPQLVRSAAAAGGPPLQRQQRRRCPGGALSPCAPCQGGRPPHPSRPLASSCARTSACSVQCALLRAWWHMGERKCLVCAHCLVLCSVHVRTCVHAHVCASEGVRQGVHVCCCTGA